MKSHYSSDNEEIDKMKKNEQFYMSQFSVSKLYAGIQFSVYRHIHDSNMYLYCSASSQNKPVNTKQFFLITQMTSLSC